MSPNSDPSGRARSPSGPPPPDSLAELCANHAPVPTDGRFPSGTVFGDWRLTAFIGRGGNGEVYCAEHANLGTPAAVKVLMREDERAKVRFTREAKLLSDLKSEAFPRFLAYGEANGRPYLAMELLEPGELPTGDNAIARFLLKVCDAVAELHSHGYVHRDIKPGNILWRTVGSCVPRDRGRAGRASLPIPVLADLGLVKEIKTTDFGRPVLPLSTDGAPALERPAMAPLNRWNAARQRSPPTYTRSACWSTAVSTVTRRVCGRASSNAPRRPSPPVVIHRLLLSLKRYAGVIYS